MTNAFHWIQVTPGVDTEESYPYEGKEKSCRFDPANVGARLRTFKELPEGDEQALKDAVTNIGPIAVGIDGLRDAIRFVKKGVYFDPLCTDDVTHAVLLVGYGTTPEGIEYWLCKNSWGADWGDEGYVKIARNQNNHCGIASLASYPIV